MFLDNVLYLKSQFSQKRYPFDFEPSKATEVQLSESAPYLADLRCLFEGPIHTSFYLLLIPLPFSSSVNLPSSKTT